jgi:hypothetical protein
LTAPAFTRRDARQHDDPFAQTTVRLVINYAPMTATIRQRQRGGARDVAAGLTGRHLKRIAMTGSIKHQVIRWG